MSRNWRKAAPEGNSPVPQQNEFGPNQLTLADVYQLFEDRLDRQWNRMKSHLDECTEKIIETRQRSASLEQGVQQPRLAFEAFVKSNKKTRKRTEGAAAAEREIGVDISPAQVDTDPIRLTSFGEDSTGPPPLVCTRDDALGDDSAAAPKPCHPWRCVRQQPPMAYSPPAQPLKQ